jgi:hypothetical protein
MSCTTSRATASDVFNGRLIEPLERIAIELRAAFTLRADDGGTRAG